MDRREPSPISNANVWCFFSLFAVPFVLVRWIFSVPPPLFQFNNLPLTSKPTFLALLRSYHLPLCAVGWDTPQCKSHLWIQLVCSSNPGMHAARHQFHCTSSSLVDCPCWCLSWMCACMPITVWFKTQMMQLCVVWLLGRSLDRRMTG